MSPSTGDEALFSWGEYYVGGNNSGTIRRTILFARRNRASRGPGGCALGYVAVVRHDESISG
jgi:hypothetical protein